MIALKLDALMEKGQKRAVHVRDGCFEKGKGYSMTKTNLSLFQRNPPGLVELGKN